MWVSLGVSVRRSVNGHRGAVGPCAPGSSTVVVSRCVVADKIHSFIHCYTYSRSCSRSRLYYVAHASTQTTYLSRSRSVSFLCCDDAKILDVLRMAAQYRSSASSLVRQHVPDPSQGKYDCGQCDTAVYYCRRCGISYCAECDGTRCAASP